MSRPIIYVSGPISNGGLEPIWKQRDYVHFATEIAFHLIRMGFSVICPHWSFLAEHAVRQNISHADWIANDLPMIEKCDALYRLPDESKGADMEVAHAESLGIPVFRDVLAMCGHFQERLK